MKLVPSTYIDFCYQLQGTFKFFSKSQNLPVLFSSIDHTYFFRLHGIRFFPVKLDFVGYYALFCMPNQCKDNHIVTM